MFLSFYEFIFEKENFEINLAKKLSANKELSSILNDCEEGKFPWIQIVITPGANSYVGVALNDGSSVSSVYATNDPKIALVAIVIKNTKRDSPEEIISILKAEDAFLAYSVFAGDRAMTQQEAADRFNFTYQIAPGDAVPFYTSTPIKKNY